MMNNNEVYATYLIPESRIDALVKRINKLANKINKGKTHADFPPSIEVQKHVTFVKDAFTSMKPYDINKEYDDPKFYSFVWATIHYQRPVLNGWQLVAVYDWEETPNNGTVCYVSPVPGQMVPPQFRNVKDGQCDHCKTNRRRKKSMLVTKNFLEFKVVGSSCVKDFLGHATPNSLIDVYSFELAVEDTIHNVNGMQPNMALHDIKKILTLSSMFVRKFGYVKVDDYDKMPTRDCIHRYIHPDPISSFDKQFINNNVPQDKDKEKAEKVIKWIKEQSNATDYMHNLQKCVEAGAISNKRIGILASAVVSYDKATERADRENNSKANQWIGNIKDRLKGLQATVKRFNCIDGYYGMTTIVTLETEEGNTLVWFATNNPDVEVGDQWELDGTVKDHNDYNGTRQTILTRVKYNVIETV